MSFPGYLKSLQLKNRRHTENGPVLDDISADRLNASEQDDSSKQDCIADSPTLPRAEQGSRIRLDIMDERGNLPTRSLWVGNIPPRTSGVDLRALFGRYGPIISTKTAAKYAFVNFENIESALDAFKDCHDCDIFNTGNSTINIRFTSTLAEVRQGKDEMRPRGNSMTKKIEAVQRQWFAPDTDKSNEPMADTSAIQEWPNGQPPSGPKSHRKEISPPPLRRGDSYRPPLPARQDSQQSGISRGRSYDKKSGRGADVYRPSEHRSTNLRSASWSRSRSSSFSRSESSSPNHTARRDSSKSPIQWPDSSSSLSPLPWERTRKHREADDLRWDQEHDQMPELASALCNALQNPTLPTTTTAERSVSGLAYRVDITGDNVDNDDLDDNYSPKLLLQTPVSTRCESCDPQHDPQPVNHIAVESTRDELLVLDPLLKSGQLPKSPLLRAMERVFGTRHGVRGGSVASEVATSSSKTSTRKKRCGDCKKVASDLSPLMRCSTCSRGYHSGCGDPKPSGCPDVSRFVCGRCLQKATPDLTAEAAVSAPPATSKDDSNAKLNGKVHLISPPLTHNQDGNGSTQLSPCEDLPHAVSNPARIESLFDVRDSTRTSEVEVPSVTQHHPRSAHTRRNSEKGFDLSPRPPMRSKDQAAKCSQGLTISHQHALRYKIVTCKWWAAGICTQSEEGCYYAHSYTNISFPGGKKPNRYWTCYNWLCGDCDKHEESCLYSHKDTGLHVGRDGSPSFKHVTCYWWIRSNCRFSEKLCKFAHKDTGLYGLDPSEKWHGGPKFSTVHPSLASDQRTRQFPGPHLPTGNFTFKSFIVTENPDVKEPSRYSYNPSAQVSSTSAKVIRADLVTASQRPSQLLGQIALEDAAQLKCSISASKNDEQLQISPASSFGSYNGHHRSVVELGTEEQNDTNLLAHAALENLEDRTHCNSVTSISTWLLHNNDKRGNDYSDSKSSSSNVKIGQTLRDPRLVHRESAVSLQNAVLQTGNPPTTSGTDTDREQAASEVTAAGKPLPDETLSVRKSLSRCKLCQKPVFGSQVCRTCVSDGSEQKPPNPSGQSSVSNALSLVSSTTIDQDVDVANALAQDLGHEVKEPSIRPAPKNPLKRIANADNMFLKNKRPKHSMLFSSGGKLHLSSIKHLAKGQGQQTKNVLSQKMSQSRQSLDDLIREERAKNEMKPSEVDINTAFDKTHISTSSKENESSDSADETTSSRTSSPLPTIESIENTARSSNKVEDACSSNSLFDSSPQSTLRQHQATRDHSDMVQELLCSSRSNLELSAARAQKKRRRSSDYDDNMLDKEQMEVFDGRTSIPNTTKFEDHLQQDLERSEVESRGFSRLEGQSRNFPNTKDITWASSITCMACRKNHKKCLHDKDGSLSANKCHEYVLSRNGRRDTGRSNQEWQAVLGAAQLDFDRDEDEASLSTDDFDIASRTSCTDASEETSATGYMNDSSAEHMFGNRIGKLIGMESKIKKVPTVIVNVPVSRETSQKVAMARVRKPAHEFVWTTEDEMQATMRLKSKGVIFESDSEDEDYLSDDYQAPQPSNRPIDPLHVPLRCSRDLYEVAPELSPQRMEEDQMAKLRSMQPRPSRKEQWALLRSKQLQERRERFGNPHHEVNRIHAETMVIALVERVVSPANSEHDRFAVGSVQTKEEKIGFAKFLGVPKSPRACLMSDRKRLAFRDGRNEVGHAWIRTSRGLSKRITDDDKFPVRIK